MKTIAIIFSLIICSFSYETSTNLPISDTSQATLSRTFINLVIQLRKINTTAQNNYLLSRRINDTYDVLSEIIQQLSQYNNIIWGDNNVVDGQKNFLVGSYENVTGSNNFVLVEKYTGQIDGDLVLENWRVELDKRNLVLLYPNQVVFPLNKVEQNTYGRYLNYRTDTTRTNSMTSTLSIVRQISTITTIIQGTQTNVHQVSPSSNTLPSQSIDASVIPSNLRADTLAGEIALQANDKAWIPF